MRGLDYYTHTLFEFQSAALGNAQSTILGGGRYDGLIEQLGGPTTPGIGLRLRHRARAAHLRRRGRVRRAGHRASTASSSTPTGARAATSLTQGLRLAGVATDRAFDARSMKAQMKAAVQSGARLAAHRRRGRGGRPSIVTVRDLETGEQTTVARDVVVDHIRKVLEP